MPLDDPVSLRIKPPSTSPQATRWRGEKKTVGLLKRLWHRRAIEAASMPAASRSAQHRAWRERRVGTRPLLFVMHEGAAPSAYAPGAPSKRATTGDAAHGCANQRQRPGRGAFVHHEKERRQRDSWVRVRPAGSWQCCPRASMRPRWPVDATPLNKTRRSFSPPVKVSPAARWMGAWCAGSPGRRGASRRAASAPGAPRRHAPVHTSPRALSEPGRPGRVQTHV